MNVYIIEPHNEYCFGSVIVAANSEEEAKELYLDENEFNKFMYEECKCSCRQIKDLTYTGTDIILSDTLYME